MHVAGVFDVPMVITFGSGAARVTAALSNGAQRFLEPVYSKVCPIVGACFGNYDCKQPCGERHSPEIVREAIKQIMPDLFKETTVENLAGIFSAVYGVEPETLYPAMEDFQLDLIIGEGPAARSVKIDLARFTLVAATTRLGLLTNPLRDRFGIPVRLDFYTVEELEKIVSRGARILSLPMSEDGAVEIARRARGTPRIAGRLLRRVRDFASVAGAGTVDRKVADAALTRLEDDALGLDSLDRRYLTMIAGNFGGGPVGIETIAAGLSEPRDAIEDIIEPYLIQQGFIQRTPRGRMLTANAWRHLGLEAPRDLAVRQTSLFEDDS